EETAAEVEDARSVLRDAGSTVAVLRPGGSEADLAVDAYGRLTSPRFRVLAEAAQMSEEDAARVLALFDAQVDDAAAPVAHPAPVVAPVSAPVSLRLLGPVAVSSPVSADPD